MVSVTLVCAIVGVAGSAFLVDIDASQLVGHLKDAIKAKKPDTIKGEADKLQLFLAKKDDAWLKSSSKDVKKLKKGEQTAVIEELTHEDNELDGEFGIEDVLEGTKHPSSKQIHVLVVVPEGAVGSASESCAPVQVAAGKGTPVDGFTWESVIDKDGHEISLTEEMQRKRYREYVERNIGAVLAAQQLCVIGVEIGQDILSVSVPGRNIDLAGRTDLLILSDLVHENPCDVQYLPGVKMLIEVKREVKASSDFQALSELIALDLLVDNPVMALLTDLNGKWLFFWVSERKGNSARIYKATIKKPGEAFEVIRTLLAQAPTADAEIRLPFIKDPVKRLKLSEVLPPIAEGGESGGIRECIERYYDIASMLGPDLDMARAVARQVTRSIPAFSYFS